MKRPAFQFYPADWRKDPALSACSLAARGLWIELMCIAHEAETYGLLSINDKPMTNPQIARMVGESPAAVAKLIAELEDAGVFSRDERGAIYSRRMVNDERIRNVRAESGRLGGNPNLLKQKDKQMVKQNDNQSPTPSSSSSSSPSGNSVPDGTDAAGVKSGDPPPTDPPKQDKPPMEPDEIIFGYGVPLLVNAGSADKAARSFLGGLRKQHGDTAVIDKLRECIRAKPLQPLEWLAAALPPKTAPGKHTGFQNLNYREGVSADGSLV